MGKLNRNCLPTFLTACCFSLALLFLPGRSKCAEPFVDVSIDNFYSSNIYMNDAPEGDYSLQPELLLGVMFFDQLALGYDGRLEYYALHPDLFFHQHEAFLTWEPVFGVRDRHSFLLDIAVETQRNTDQYREVNLLAPSLKVGVDLEPVEAVRVELSADGQYRLFYDARETSSVDTFADVLFRFTFRSRTAIAPSAGIGVRAYTDNSAFAPTDKTDVQLDAGIRISQGLGELTGLWASYMYRYIPEPSGSLVSAPDPGTFDYVGEDFLSAGHQVDAGFRQLFTDQLSARIEAGWGTADYLGWPVIDGAGVATDQSRFDERLTLGGKLELSVIPGEDKSRAVPGFSALLGYEWFRQWSSDPWYDTDRHLVRLDFTLSW